MKKFIALLMAALLAMTLFAGCANGDANTDADAGNNTETQEPEAPKGNDQSGETVEALIEKIYEQKMPEFPLMTMPVDLADAEATAWLTGVSDPALLKEAAVSESMMGAQAYSLVLARVADAAKAEEVANMMLENIDPRKWICVAADDIDAAIYGDLVLFVMIDSGFGIPAADFIGEFKTIAGGNLDKELSK